LAIELLHDQPLRALNSFGVAATAATLVRIRLASDLAGLPACLAPLRQAQDPGPALILGGGSNWLPIGRIRQPLVQCLVSGQRRIPAETGDPTRVLVEADAGSSWDTLVQWTLQQGLAGLENLSLIPGTVGGAPIQNIGAYGVELSDCFDSLEAFHLESGQRRRFGRDDCGFGYRDSVFKHAQGRGWLITTVRLRLSPAAGAELKLDYGDLRAWLRDAGIASPQAQDVAQAVCAIRRSKLPDPAVLGNAGSFFKNPIIDAPQAVALRQSHPAMPMWPVSGEGVGAGHGEGRGIGPTDTRTGSAGRFKLAAAWMIEQCGWRGHREGDAGVHAAHALVLVNHGAARGQDILALADRIIASVRAKFGVDLEPEPLIVRGELEA
jgi:UDP-N-acetylmuramate dehydrogenase